jgi:hypothetical protein
VAAQMKARVIQLDDGRILEDSGPRDATASPQGEVATLNSEASKHP